MKKFISLLLLLSATRLLAVNAVPYTEAVNFSAKLTTTGGGGTVTVYEDSGSMGTGFGSSGTESPLATAQLRPNKQYVVNFAATIVGTYAGPGTYTFSGSYAVNFVAPAGYLVLVNGIPFGACGGSFSFALSRGTTAISYNYTVEIRPLQGAMARAGHFSGIQLGQSVSWSAGLGGLRTGRGADQIRFKQFDLTSSPANREQLYYVAPINDGQITTVYDGSSSSTLKQIMTPQTFVNLTDLVTGTPDDGYTISYYTPAQASWNSSTSTYSLVGTPTPWRTIEVQSTVANNLTVTETEGTTVRVSNLNLDTSSGTVASGTYKWILQESDGTTVRRTTTHVSTNNGDGTRDDVVTVVDGTAGTLAAKTKYHYVTESWGEVVGAVIADPDTAALTTSYTYYASTSAPGNYGQVESVTYPTGSWASFLYYDDWNRRGMVQTESRPFQGSPSTVTAASGTVGSSVNHDYVADFSGRYRLESNHENRTTNIRTGLAVTTPTLYQLRNSLYYTISQTDASASSTQTQRTITEVIDPVVGASADFTFLPYAVKRPDQTQDSYEYALGTYSGTTFTASTSGTYFRTIVWHGSSSSTGADTFSSYGGLTVSTIYLVANQSTMEITVNDPTGHPVRHEIWVYTGSGVFSSSPIKAENFSYDFAGRLLEHDAIDGSTTIPLTVNTYANGRRISTVGVDGTETDNSTWDELGRVLSSVHKGASASGTYLAQADITTTNTYDAVGHVTQTVSSGPTNSLTTLASYDLAGRPTSSTAPGSYVTGYGYSSDGLTVTTTLPGGATKVSENYLDGQLMKVSGTAVVEQDLSYTVNSTTGDITRQVISGTATSTNVVQTTGDWLGRPLTEVRPQWGGGSVTRSWSYNSYGQTTKFSQPGVADTLYSYDTMGFETAEGLDLNANGTLDPASSDRITTHAWTYFLSSSAWWRRDTTGTYATSSSGTATTTGKVETQLSGFSPVLSGYVRLSHAKNYDIYANVSETYTEVKAASKLSVATALAPASTSPDVQTSYNGLLETETDTTARTMTYGYDDLGRLVSSSDPRKGATITQYFPNTNQVYTVTDPAGVAQQTYAYDSTTGNVKSLAIPNPNDGIGGDGRAQLLTYYTYTARNEPWQTWGDTAVPVAYGYDNWGHRTTMSTYRGGTGWGSNSWPTSPGTADTTIWHYDEPTGFLNSKEDAAIPTSHSVSYTYAAAGQILTRQWARIFTGTTHVTTTYGYSTTTGELTSVGYNDSTPGVSYTYNRLGQMATAVDSNTGTHTFTYNLTGTLELQNEVLGIVSSNFYGDRKITRLYDTTTAGAIGRYNELQVGNSTNASADDDQTYTYDAYSRLSTTAGFTYAYATSSNLIGSTTNSTWNFTDTRTYDPKHDWTTERKTVVSTSTTPIKADFAYTPDSIGRATKVAKQGDVFSVYGNGTEGLTTNYSYDDRSELTSEVTDVGTSATVLAGRNDSNYSYDSIGNRTAWTHNGNTVSYSANSLNQYTQRDVAGYADVAGSDTAGTVTVATTGYPTDTAARSGQYFFDGYALTNTSNPVFANLTVTGSGSATVPAYLAQTPEPFTYDADGNLTQDGRWVYIYDSENRLIEQFTRGAPDDPNHAVAGNVAVWSSGLSGQKLLYTYDYLGRRASKALSNWDVTSASWLPATTGNLVFLYDGWNLVMEYNPLSSMAAVRRHAWGLDLSETTQGAGGVGGLLFSYDYATAQSYVPVYDANGNVHGMIKASDGSLAAAYEYDAFGRLLVERGAGTYPDSNPFRYSTCYTDVETGLIYYGHRYYSPGMGRFINRDPSEESGGLNLYGFCRNGAVNAFDILGLNPDQKTLDWIAEVEKVSLGNWLQMGGGGGSASNSLGLATTSDQVNVSDQDASGEWGAPDVSEDSDADAAAAKAQADAEANANLAAAAIISSASATFADNSSAMGSTDFSSSSDSLMEDSAAVGYAPVSFDVDSAPNTTGQGTPASLSVVGGQISPGTCSIACAVQMIRNQNPGSRTTQMSLVNALVVASGGRLTADDILQNGLGDSDVKTLLGPLLNSYGVNVGFSRINTNTSDSYTAAQGSAQLAAALSSGGQVMAAYYVGKTGFNTYQSHAEILQLDSSTGSVSRWNPEQGWQAPYPNAQAAYNDLVSGWSSTSPNYRTYVLAPPHT